MRCADTPEVRPQRAGPVASAHGLLSLAAAPTFALMALLSGTHGGGMSDMLCVPAHDASPLNGMVPMYALMSVFHSGSWLRLITRWRGSGLRQVRLADTAR